MIAEHLIENWRAELNRLWSVRLATLSAIFGALENLGQILPIVSDYIPPKLFGYLSVLCALAVPLARIVKQP